MTQYYDAENQLVPVTVVEAGPCPVTQIKTVDNDGYNAVQIAFQEQKEQRLSKALRGHFKKAGAAAHRILKEFRVDSSDAFKAGETLTVARFSEGQRIDVIGNTKGRGFQGVMKRWNFDGQPATHGHMMHRRGGSIGMRQTPGHVFKGKKMPGHMGTVQRTVQNLTVVKVIEDKNLILISGSFPGANGDTIFIREAKKAKKQ